MRASYTSTHAGSHVRHLLLIPALTFLASCEVVQKNGAKQDTTTAPPSGMVGPVPTDTSSVSGVPAAPSDSLAASVARDTGVVQLSDERPTRGGVLFAMAEGVATDIPRCSWKGAPLPCYRTAAGVLAIVPLPADDPAGTFSLVFERPAGRITRQITVTDRNFGRELVFLDSARFALVSKPRDVARDARAIRAILSGESPQRRWSGAWRTPVQGGRGSGYGVERFYYRAADSSRAIALGPEMTTRGAFGLDTSAAAGVPSWRHAGIDMAVSRGAAVVAAASGLVADVSDYILSGRTLLIDHGQGVFTAYFHLDTVLVRRGDEVRAGKRVARVGSTGLSTGPHLHYGLYVHGKDVDPAAWAAMPAFARDTTAPRGVGSAPLTGLRDHGSPAGKPVARRRLARH